MALSKKYFYGWYGSCDGDVCEEVSFHNHSARQYLDSVIRVSSADGKSFEKFTAYNPSSLDWVDTLNSSLTFDDYINPQFKSLECGMGYLMVRKEGYSGAININGFAITDFDGEAGFVAHSCPDAPSPTPVVATPSPTPVAPSPTPVASSPTPVASSPTPSPTPAEVVCTPADFTKVSMVSAEQEFSDAQNQIHTFSALPSGIFAHTIDTTTSFYSTGAGSVITFTLSGTLHGILDFTNVMVLTGATFYRELAGKCYRGIVDTAVTHTDGTILVEFVMIGDAPEPTPTPTPTLQPTPTPTPQQPQQCVPDLDSNGNASMGCTMTLSGEDLFCDGGTNMMFDNQILAGETTEKSTLTWAGFDDGGRICYNRLAHAFLDEDGNPTVSIEGMKGNSFCFYEGETDTSPGNALGVISKKIGGDSTVYYKHPNGSCYVAQWAAHEGQGEGNTFFTLQ